MGEGDSFHRELVVFKNGLRCLMAEWMENDPKRGCGAGIAQVSGDDFVEAGLTVQMKVVCTPEQVHGKQQPHQSEVMVTMKMRDQDVADAVHVGVVAHELHLHAFSAINEKIPVLDFHQLSGRKPPVCRQRAAGSEYGDGEGDGCWLLVAGFRFRGSRFEVRGLKFEV